MTQTKPTLQQFYDRLAKHDWYFSFSDDHLVYHRGAAADDRLKADAKSYGLAYQELHEAFSKHMFSGKPWGTERAPHPERPPLPEQLGDLS